MKIKYAQIVKLLFLALSLIIFANLNGVLRLTFGFVSLLSPIILILSIAIISMSVFVLKVSLKDINLIWLIVFYVCYLYIGTSSLLWSDYYLSERTSVLRLYRSYISSIVILFAFYLGAKAIMMHYGYKSIYNYIFPFFIFTTCAVVFGEQLGIYNSFEYMVEAQRGERSAGFFGNPNEAGSFANYALVIFLTLFFISKKKAVFIGLAGLAIAGSVLSFSKAAFIISTLMVLFFFFKNITFFHKSTQRTRIAFVTLIFGLIFGVFAFFNSSTGQKFELTRAQQKRIVGTLALLSGEINEETTSDRTVVYSHGFGLIKRNPYIGHGIGTFHRFNSGNMKIGVHNTYILILGESGILPILLFLGFYFMLIYRGLMITDAGLSFFIIGVTTIYMLGVAGTSHNALDDRTSNALVSIILAILSYRKQCVE
ncbi:MAG: O-antigen ligase family protein [Bacteroidota bacterium]